MSRDQTATRARVVAAARAWVGTPYLHAADIKGVGVDCAMILVRVFCDLDLVPSFDPRPYVKDWMLHRDDERYLGFLFDRARPVPSPEPGDVIVFRIGRCFAHGGIVTSGDPLTFVHAFSPTGCVIEEPAACNPQLSGRLASARFFSIWGGLNLWPHFLATRRRRRSRTIPDCNSRRLPPRCRSPSAGASRSWRPMSCSTRISPRRRSRAAARAGCSRLRRPRATIIPPISSWRCARGRSRASVMYGAINRPIRCRRSA